MDDPVRKNRQRLIEALVPAAAHEINNHNQTVLLSAQVLLEIWQRLKPITDRYWQEHGDFSAGSLAYSAIREELTEYFANIIQGAERTDQILGEIRALARPDAVPAATAVNLNLLIQGTVTLLATQLKRATDRLQLDLASGLPQFQGRPQGIQQVLLNLVRNAFQALDNRSQGIRIRTSYNDRQRSIICEIADQGRGMGPSTLDRVRDFFLASPESERPDYPGFAAVRAILNEHRARVELHSEEGKGTRIVLAFPIEQTGNGAWTSS